MGFFNNISYEASDTVAINDNEFFVKINCERSVFVTIFFSELPVRLIVQPGDSIFLSLDLSVKDKRNKVPCNIEGSNACGQALFYDYNYWPIEKYENIWKILKGDKNSIIPGVKKEINKQTEPFKNLYIHKKINKNFYDLIYSNISALLLFESLRKILDVNIVDLHLPSETRNQIANSLIRLYSPQNTNLYYGVNSTYYPKVVLDYKRALSLNHIGIYRLPDTMIAAGNKKFTIIGDFSYLLLEPNKKLREVLFGTQLLNYLEIGGGLELLKNEIAYFKYEYPNSPYNNIIANYKAAIYTRKSQLSVTKKFQLTPIVIIDSNGLIQDLSFAGYPFLKDSIVFAEVWATWCGPCLSEMQYNFPVDSLLYQYKIKRLYISIDNVKDKEKWVNEIFKMNLSGYHILAGEALQSLLTKDFGFGESLMAIPRYFIIRKGKIVILDAFRPSEFEKLKNQLKEISDFKN